MLDPFVLAAAAQFRAPGSSAAAYAPPGGGLPVPCRAIVSTTPVDLVVGSRQIEAGSTMVELQRSDFAPFTIVPQRGGNVVADGTSYVIIGEPRLDLERTAWTCEATTA